MHQYDTTLKLLLQESAVIRELAGTITRWINVELPELQNTRVDLLGETADGVLIHIELESRNDPSMPLRMAEYCLRIFRITGRFPRQIVLYVGQEPLRMKSELTAGENLVFRYRLIDIREFDGDQLIESSRIGDNVIAILARLRDNRQAVHEILARLARLEPGPREFYLRAPLILAGLRKLGTVIEEEAISRRTASRGKCRRQHRQ